MPHPELMLHGLVVAISRARATMVCAGTPVMRAAHCGVFSMPSGPLPSM
ncbi:Uncharacterised protein [Mycobacteroides abscessus subsp. abscessus]|nr:Uncharacterised protein [Mycobacteroides abscessus subsp. abscessus]